MKKLFTIFLALSMFWTSLGLKVQAEEIQDIIPCAELRGSNFNRQDYLSEKYDMWSAPISSYLEKTEDGWMRFICDTSFGTFDNGLNYYMIDYFDENFNEINRILLPKELPIFGGFYATDNAYYIVTGQENPDEDNSKEVLRVTQYNKKWELLQTACVSGINTKVPFYAGSLRMDDDGSYLYIRTSRKSYSGHQANMTFQFHMGLLTLTDCFTGVMYDTYGYISHSFNQFIKIDGNSIVAVDHGDAYPRSILLMKYNTDCSDGTFYPNKSGMVDRVTLLDIYGETWENITGASVGGLEISDTHYLVVGSSKPQDENYQNYKTANIFISKVDKATLKNETLFVTNYPEGEVITSTPQLVKINENRFVVLYEANGFINYIILDGTGTIIQEAKEIVDGSLSDCQPVVHNNILTWYGYSQNVTTFYQLEIETNNFTQTTIDTGHKHVALSEVKDGFVEGICSKCKEQYVVKCLENFGLWSFDDSYERVYFDLGTRTKLKVGETVASILALDYAKGTDYDITDFYDVKIMDPSVLKHEMDDNLDIFVGLKDGVTNVIFTSRYNPAIKVELLYTVGDYEPYMPPEKVVHLNASQNEDLSITLTWDSSKYASSYEIYYKETNGNNDFVLLDNTIDTTITLSELNPKPNTSYTFKVVAINKNGVSKENEEVVITSRDLPSVVENVVISQYSNKAVELVWDKAKGADSYDIYCKNIIDNSEFKKVKTVTDTKARISDLTTEETYAFYVIASNRAGLAEPSNQVKITLSYMKPPVPENFKYEQPNNNEIRLTWDACDGATIYYIYLKPDMSGEYHLEKTTTETSVVFDNVYPSNIYRYYVIAKNELGESQSKTLEVEMMLLGKPELSIEEISEGKFKLTWTEIEGAKGYDIYILKPNKNKFEFWQDTRDGSLEYTTNYLLTGDYSFYIKAAPKRDYVAGDFDYAEASNIVEAKSTYNKPIIQLESNVNDITVSWDRITDIYYYDIYCKGYGENDEFKLVKTVSDTKVTITDLTHDSTYTFYVIGRNSSGLTTSPSEEVQIKTKKAEIPDVVTNLIIEQNAYNEAILKWDKNTRAKAYDVYAKGYNGNSEYQLLGSVSNLTFKVSDLQPEKTYTFYVVAKNEAGISDRSNEVEIITPKVISNLSLEQASNNSLRVSWNPVEGASSYYVYNYDGYLHSIVEETTALINSLRVGNAYTVYVVAKDKSNVIAASEIKSITLKFQSKPKLSVEKISSTKFKLNWTAVEAANYYSIYEKYNNNDYKYLTSVENTTEYETEALLEGTHDFYVVAHQYQYSNYRSEPSNIVSVESVYERPEITIYTGCDFAHIIWDKIEGATAYQVYSKDINSSDEFVLTQTQKFGNATTIEDLEIGKTYAFYVVAINGEASSQPSEIVQVTIPEQTLNPIENLNVEQIKYNEVKLTWDKVEGATAYRVYDKSLNLLQVVNDTTVNVKNLKTGLNCYFLVVAINDEKISSLSDWVSIEMKLIGESELSIEQVSSTRFKLTWTPIDGAQSYRVYSSYNGGVYNYLIRRDEENLEYTTSELLPGNYNFYVVGLLETNTDPVTSNPSNIATGVSYFEKPFVTLSSRLNEITVSWNDIEGVTSYDVYLKGYEENDEFVCVDNVEGNKTVISELDGGKTYTIYVVGKNGDITTEPSDYVQITLKKFGDKTALKALIDEVNNWKDIEKYSLGSWKKVTASLSNATYVYQKEEAMQEEVDAVIADLELQICELVNRSILKSLIEQAKVILENADDYYEDSIYVLSEKYHSAVFTYEDTTYYSQADCDYKADELDKAIKAIKEKPLNAIPSPVVNLVANDTNYKTITLTWSTNKRATAYDVYRKAWNSEEFKLYKSTTDTTLAVTGVMTGKEYAFYVVAKNEAGVAEASATVSKATTLHGKVKLTSEKVSTSKFKLSWNKIDGATRYIVYRKRNNDKMKKVLTLGAKDLEYTTAELPYGDYQFILKAGRYDSKDRVMTNASNTVAGSVEKVAPAVSLTVGSKQVNVSWNKVEGVTYYEVYLATNEEGTYTKLTTTKELSYTAKSLSSGKKYFFKVRGYKLYKSGTEIKYDVYTPYSTIGYAIVK